LGEHGVTAEEVAEQVRRLSVGDLVVSTASALAQVGYAKLDPAARELEQAQLAIDALDALLPIIERGDADAARDFRQVVANLKLAFAQAAADRPEEEPEADE